MGRLFCRGTVRAFDQVGVERDRFRAGVEEELERIVAGLAVDIDRAGECGSAGVFEPPVVGLPTVGRGDEHDVAAAGVVHAVFGDALGRQHFGDARPLGEQAGDAFDRLWVGILDEDVRELVIDECPGFAGGEIEVLAVFHFADFQQAGLAEDAVWVDHIVNRRDHVLARGEPERGFGVRLLETGDELSQLGVEVGHGLVRGLAVGPALLCGVVQVRQVNVEEVGAIFFGRDNRRVDDPSRRLNSGERSPKVLQRKVALLGFQLIVKAFGPREAPRRFAAVGVVHRSGRANVIGAAAFAVEREPDGRGDRAVAVVQDVPNLGSLDAVVPGGPHFDPPLIAPVEAVGHDAMLAGRAAGRHVGLNRAGDRRKAGH